MSDNCARISLTDQSGKPFATLRLTQGEWNRFVQTAFRHGVSVEQLLVIAAEEKIEMDAELKGKLVAFPGGDEPA